MVLRRGRRVDEERRQGVARLITLFHTYADRVFTVARRLLWNVHDAEDVVQATFVEAYVHLDELRDPQAMRAWLYRIAYREALAVLARRRDVPTDPAKLRMTAPAPDPAVLVIQDESARALHRSILQLEEPLRSAFVLRDVEELSMAEVAQVLDIGLSAAKMRVHRARLQLREIVRQEVTLAVR